MNSTPDTKEAASPDAPTGRPDERLAHAYEEIKRADEQLTRMSEQLAKIEGGVAHPPAASASKGPATPLPSEAAPSSAEFPAQPAPAETVSAEVPPAQPSAQIQSPPISPTKSGNRSTMALLLAACFVIAALIGSTYGGGIVTRWAPQLGSKESSTPEAPTLAAQSAPALVQVAATETTSLPVAPQEAPSQARSVAQAQPASQDAAPPVATAPVATAPAATAPVATAPAAPAPAAAAPPDQAALLQKIARDLATLEQNIQQLKASQQQMAGENSKAIGELKASQEELKRTIAKVSPQPLPKVTAPAAPPVSVVRRPERNYQPPQARARPRYYQRDDWIYDDW